MHTSETNPFTNSDIKYGIYGGYQIRDDSVVEAIKNSSNKVHHLGNAIGRDNTTYGNLANLNGELRTCAGIWSANNENPTLKEEILASAESIIEAVGLTLKEVNEKPCFYGATSIYPDHSEAARLHVQQVQRYFHRG